MTWSKRGKTISVFNDSLRWTTDLKHLSPLELSSNMPELAIFWYVPSWTPLFFYCIFPLVLLSMSATIGKGICNRYFHPLSRFPGPFWASMTDIYLAFFIKSIPTYGLEMHKKHGKHCGCSNRGPLIGIYGSHWPISFAGPFVRLAPNMLSFSDPRLLPEVYHRQADKPPFYASWLFGETAAMFQTLPHGEHAAKKKVVASCVSRHR